MWGIIVNVIYAKQYHYVARTNIFWKLSGVFCWRYMS